MSQEESDSESIECCYTCGVFLDDENEVYVTGFSTSGEMRQFCSKRCCEKNTKHVLTKTDPENPFQVPVRGTWGDKVIEGVAEFNIHGTVKLFLSQPGLTGEFVIPRAFCDIASLLWTPNSFELSSTSQMKVEPN